MDLPGIVPSKEEAGEEPTEMSKEAERQGMRSRRRNSSIKQGGRKRGRRLSVGLPAHGSTSEEEKMLQKPVRATPDSPAKSRNETSSRNHHAPSTEHSKPVLKPPMLQRRSNRIFHARRRSSRSKSDAGFNDMLSELSGIVEASAFLKRRKAVETQEEEAKETSGRRRLTLTLLDRNGILPKQPHREANATQRKRSIQQDDDLRNRRRITAMMIENTESERSDLANRKPGTIVPTKELPSTLGRSQTVGRIGGPSSSTSTHRHNFGAPRQASVMGSSFIHSASTKVPAPLTKSSTVQSIQSGNLSTDERQSTLFAPWRRQNDWLMPVIANGTRRESDELGFRNNTNLFFAQSHSQTDGVGDETGSSMSTSQIRERTLNSVSGKTEVTSEDDQNWNNPISRRESGAMKPRRGTMLKKLQSYAKKVITQIAEKKTMGTKSEAGSQTSESGSDSDDDFDLGVASQTLNIKTVIGGANYDVREQLKLAGQKVPWWIVLPDSTWHIRWDLTMLVLVCYYALMVPFRIAFSGTQPHIEIDEPDEILVENIFTAMFWCDIVLNFCTATKSRGEYITDPRTIAKAYGRSWFLIDFLATLPIADIIKATSPGTDSTSVAQLNKMLRLLRIFKVLRVFRAARILARVEDFLKFNPAVMRLIKLVSAILIFWHWIGCAFWLVADLEAFGVEGPRWSREDGNTWLPPPYVWCTNYSFCNESMYEDSGFVATFDFNPFKGMRACFGLETAASPPPCPASLEHQYLYAFFWAIMVTTGIGDDVRPISLAEHLVSVALIITGVLMMAVIFGSASSAITSLNSSSVEWRSMLLAMDRFLNSQGASLALKHRVFNSLRYSQSRTLQGEDVLQDLHPTLRLDVAVAMHRQNIAKSPVFSLIRNPMAVKALVLSLQPRMFVPGEYAFQVGEVAYEMFVISEGSFGVYVGTDQLAVLGAGQVFGEMGLISHKCRNATVKALSHADTYVLHRSQFSSVMLRNPQALVQLAKGLMVRGNGNVQREGWGRLLDCIAVYQQCKQFGANLTLEQVFGYLRTRRSRSPSRSSRGSFSSIVRLRRFSARSNSRSSTHEASNPKF